MALPRLCLGVTADGSCAEDCFIEQRELSRYKRRRLRVKTGREEEADELLAPTDGRGGDGFINESTSYNTYLNLL